jgi:REP element-mobilizing transposase RayT
VLHRTENNFKIVNIGGIDDHTHILFSLPAHIAVSEAVQLVKGGSSKWVHDTIANTRSFGWQEGFGPFSVSLSKLDEVKEYIANQAEHHRKLDFATEWKMLLEKHGMVEYQPSREAGLESSPQPTQR